ncbi:MAG TPA: butyrate kinase [Firmicutes bacterium]|nr:butyrate kinase [Bacillota bacterium]
MYRILTINPGSTSTKIGIFEDETLIREFNLFHPSEELKKYPDIDSEMEFRRNVIVSALEEAKMDLHTFSAISCRGGIIKHIPSGTYLINEAVLYDSRHSQFKHPSNLAALIGHSLGQKYGLKAYITNPPSTLEADPIALVTGLPFIERPMTFHALNHKAIAKKHCLLQGIEYNKSTLIVAHLGGGASIGIHHLGRVIDVSDAMGEGPFTPERSGALPAKQVIDECFSGKYDHQTFLKFLRGNAGFQAYLGTNDMREVLKMIDAGNEKARFYFDAYVYQVAKEIGAMATVRQGHIDAILITGGIAKSRLFIDEVKKRVEFIAPVFVYPGEEELQALNYGVLYVLRGEEPALEY